MRSASGFTTIELVVATAVLMVITAGAWAALLGTPETFATQQETADMHQRLRVAIDALQKDLMSAGGVRPSRWGATSPDPPGTFKSDTITAVSTTTTTTYWLKSDDANGTYQLMSYAGGASSDVPLADHVVALAFAYFADAHVPLDAAQLIDGPWLPDASAPSRWDADLDRVHAVDVTLRVQSAIASLRGPAGTLFTHAGTAASGRRWVPDITVHFVVAPRNLNLAN